MAKVLGCAQVAKMVLFEGPEEECLAFCEDYGWVYTDENEFVWDLEIDD